MPDTVLGLEDTTMKIKDKKKKYTSKQGKR